MSRHYSELIEIPTFEDRFQYLQTRSPIGDVTFGGRRYLNQKFYTSEEWRRIRRDVIIRDSGCDLACSDYPIYGQILIHHIEPITPEDLIERRRKVFDMDNLICVSFNTHNAIHYSDKTLLQTGYVERSKNDTCPWR